MRKPKVILAIISFLLVMSAILTGALYFLHNFLNTNQALASTLAYRPSDIDLLQSYSNGSVSVQLDKMIDASEMTQSYNQELYRYIAVYGTLIFILFFISVAVLGYALYRYQQDAFRKTVMQLQDFTDEHALADTPLWMKSAYAVMKEQFDKQLDSYQRLYAYLSHEKKNQIAVLKANTDISNDPTNLRILNSISDSVDDLMTLSENKGTADLYEIDTALVCAQVCDAYKGIATINFSFEEESNTNIMAKERWIYRAVSNLVDNAIKYSAGEPVHVDIQNKNHSVVISVQDHGGGLSEEQSARIFDHKYRVNKLKQDGYGIGLSLVSHVCNLCEGFVFVESEAGAGSIFYLSFPEVVRR